MLDTAKLEEGLAKLRGLDFEQCEAAERAAGNTFPEISFQKSFQARLAAKALGVNPHDIKELPLREYNSVCQRVFNFLFTSSDGETPSEKSAE